MAWFEFLWTERAIDKLAQHGLTQEDFEYAFEQSYREEPSRSSNRMIRWGFTADGRHIATVFEWIEPQMSVLPITAYEV